MSTLRTFTSSTHPPAFIGTLNRQPGVADFSGLMSLPAALSVFGQQERQVGQIDVAVAVQIA